jgi:hypothetical protein
MGLVTILVIAVGPVAAASAVIKLSPTSLPNALVGQAYSDALTASGGTGPYKFAVTAGALPAGITLTSDGLLSGTATNNATNKFAVQATDSLGATGSRNYTLISGLVFKTLTLRNAGLELPYSAQIVVAGGSGPYTFAITSGAPPIGVSLSSDGVLSGTPDSGVGTYKFTVQASDASSPAQSNSHTFGLGLNAFGDWTLCQYPADGSAPSFDNVTLSKGGTMSDQAGAAGTWYNKAFVRLFMTFLGRTYIGDWFGDRQFVPQYLGSYYDAVSGQWSLVRGWDNSASCFES